MTRPRARGAAALAGVIALTAGCGGDGYDVRYRIIGLERATAAGCSPATSLRPEVPGATRVRLTFRDTGATGPGALRCDVVLPLDASAPMIAVPRRGEPVAVWAEYFDDAGALLARGAKDGVAIDGGDTVTLVAAPVGDYACAPVQTTTARAFHSATLLPSGEVLLLGGLTGAVTGTGGTSFSPDAGAYAVATAELYDPIGGRSRAVSIPGLIPRAFHQTVVVSSDATSVRLLVTGGTGVNSDPTHAGNVAFLPGGTGAGPWQPAAPDLDHGRFGARGLPAELLTYRPLTHSFTRVEVGAGGPTLRTEAGTSVALAGGPVAMVGGRLASGSASPLVEVLRGDGTVSGMVNGRARIGATVTTLPGGGAIVAGGDVGADTVAVRAVDHLSSLDGAPALDVGPTDTSAMNRADHAAALLGDHVLLFGGLHLRGTTVEDQGPAALAARVSNTNYATTQLDTGAAPAVAYPDAVALHDGGVLVAGGARPGGACSRTVVCPTTSSLRFDTTSGALVPAGALGVARYGHRMTRLPDGTVLVTGGFVVDPADPERLQATAIVEQFEAHRAADDPLTDLMLTPARAPGDIARDGTGAPLAECPRIGVYTDAGAIDAAPAIDAP